MGSLSHLLLKEIKTFDNEIEKASEPFMMAIKYAILGNIIDFNPIHNTCMEDIMGRFYKIADYELAIDHSKKLFHDIKEGKTLLYLGDNCGEICLDKLLLKRIKALNPHMKLYFGVRGEPVVNDSISEDAYAVGMNEYAEIISNGDCSLGTVLPRTSPEFKQIFDEADVVIAKGQANYECLSEEKKNIYFMLFTKCQVIAQDIGVAEQKMICLNKMQG